MMFRIINSNSDYNFIGKDWDKITDEAKNFIKLLLEKNYKKRISATEALKHN